MIRVGINNLVQQINKEFVLLRTLIQIFLPIDPNRIQPKRIFNVIEATIIVFIKNLLIQIILINTYKQKQVVP